MSSEKAPSGASASVADVLVALGSSTSERLALASAAVAALVYVNALLNGFAYDDVLVLVSDPGIQSWGALPARLLEPSWPLGSAREIGAWRPLTTGVWGITWNLAGGGAWAFHALGLLLHAAATGLLVLVVAELAPLALAGLAGVVFAVHPVHTEAVANVVGSTEALAAVFVLLACLVHLRGPDSDRGGRWLGVAGLYALALLSKESAAPLPAALVLLDAARRDLTWGGLGEYLRRRAPTFIALSAVLAVVLAGRYAILGAVASSPLPLGAAALAEIPRAWTVVAAWGHYTRLLLVPVSLSADYSPALAPVLFDLTPTALVGALQASVILAAAGVAWRSGSVLGPGRARGDDASRPEATASPRLFGLGALWTAVMLLPVANVLFVSPVLVSERALYIPSAGFAICAGWGLWWLLRRHESLGLVVVALVVGGCAVRTFTRTPTWRSTETVFAALQAEHPENGRAQWVLANDLFREGRALKGLRAYAYAMGTLDSDYPLLVDLGLQLSRLDRPEPAERLLRLAWSADPVREPAPRVLSAVLRQEGRLEEAVAVAREALHTVRDSLWLEDQLSVALSQLGEHAEAVEVRARILGGPLGERWPWWVAQAEDFAHMDDTLRAEQALDSARALAGAEGTEAVGSLSVSEARVLAILAAGEGPAEGR